MDLISLEKEDGKIDITSRLETDHVLLIVEDDGPDIPEANLEKIFDPFFTTKPVGKGSGLGLSICFGIIKKMGGEIDVHSIVDEGTRFDIRFPLEISMTSKENTLSIATGSERLMPESEKGPKKVIKLLLVDDEKSFVKVLSKRLSRRNMDVTTAFSGAEGIQAPRKVHFFLLCNQPLGIPNVFHGYAPLSSNKISRTCVYGQHRRENLHPLFTPVSAYSWPN